MNQLKRNPTRKPAMFKFAACLLILCGLPGCATMCDIAVGVVEQIGGNTVSVTDGTGDTWNVTAYGNSLQVSESQRGSVCYRRPRAHAWGEKVESIH